MLINPRENRGVQSCHPLRFSVIIPVPVMHFALFIGELNPQRLCPCFRSPATQLDQCEYGHWVRRTSKMAAIYCKYLGKYAYLRCKNVSTSYYYNNEIINNNETNN